ncbi:MAG: heavy metal translocating P-type ATPase [Ruminococcus sp.]
MLLFISVPLAFFAGIGGASKRGIMIKGGKYIESVAKADCFVFDKTGTLTNGKIKVTKVTSYGEMSENDILKFSATAEEYSAHPIAQAIKQKAKLENVETLKADDYQEKAGNGVTAIIDGKNYTVGHIGLLSEEDKKKITDDTSVFLLIDGKLVGGITVNDTIRTETPKVLKNLKELGAKDLVMLTGDNKKKAESVAKLTGITKLFSNLLPNEKVKHMEELKKSHKATVFVGDGINDAPVIALADCGVAMGLGSDAAIEASDAVLSDGTLKSLPTMVKTSRRIMNTIRAVITFALVVKALVIVLAIFGIAPMWLGVLSDTGLSMICILYAMRLLKPKD